MDRLISEQGLKDWLNKWEGYIDADIIARMQYRVCDIPSEDRWIPCSEKLPTVSGWYLCTVGAHVRNPRLMRYDPSKWHGENRSTWKDTEGIYVYDWFVEAWQPLPKPWEGESE